MKKDQEKDTPKDTPIEESELEFSLSFLSSQVDLLRDPVEKVKEWVENSFPAEMHEGVLSSILQERKKSE